VLIKRSDACAQHQAIDADLKARPTEVRRVLAVFSPDARMAATVKLVDFIVDKAIADGNVRAFLRRAALCGCAKSSLTRRRCLTLCHGDQFAPGSVTPFRLELLVEFIWKHQLVPFEHVVLGLVRGHRPDNSVAFAILDLLLFKSAVSGRLNYMCWNCSIESARTDSHGGRIVTGTVLARAAFPGVLASDGELPEPRRQRPVVARPGCYSQACDLLPAVRTAASRGFILRRWQCLSPKPVRGCVGSSGTLRFPELYESDDIRVASDAHNAHFPMDAAGKGPLPSYYGNVCLR